MAEGGTRTFIDNGDGTYDEMHTFTATGTQYLNFNRKPTGGTVRVLVVRGGGAGGTGGGYCYPGAGGGAGGYIYHRSFGLGDISNFTVIVGTGGVGTSWSGSVGNPSRFYGSNDAYITANGGGGGAGQNSMGLSYPSGGGSGWGGFGSGSGVNVGAVAPASDDAVVLGNSGGSGTDGGSRIVIGSYNDGYTSIGRTAGGGGGAGGVGGNASETYYTYYVAGAGGAGVESDISGLPVIYAAGGGAAGISSAGAGGGNGTGNGGGGSTSTGGSGGSGIVIVRWIWNQ